LLQPGEPFLGKYEVRALLGKGGHAFVYECFDPFLDRSVAIKVIKSPREVGHDLGKRAQGEARVLARLDHKNLVRVLDAGVSGGLVYLVMEKLEGRTLRQALIEHGRLNVLETLTIAIQVAAGMEAAHAAGAIHRDLKPENIFILPGNAVKVLDFGVAKVMGLGAQTTQKDMLQGTVLYMSPEYLQGFGVTPRSDVFALGTILFEALYCHPLTLSGAVPSAKEAVWMQLASVPPSLDTLDPRIPRYVAKLVGRAIVKVAEQRCPSMRELREAAETALARLKEESSASGTALAARDLSGVPSTGRGLLKPISAEAAPLLQPHAGGAAKREEAIPGTPPPVSSGISVPRSSNPGRSTAQLRGLKTAIAAGTVAGLLIGIGHGTWTQKRHQAAPARPAPAAASAANPPAVPASAPAMSAAVSTASAPAPALSAAVSTASAPAPAMSAAAEVTSPHAAAASAPPAVAAGSAAAQAVPQSTPRSAAPPRARPTSKLPFSDPAPAPPPSPKRPRPQPIF
jgi:serine/threonine-protein kinase